MQKFLTGKFYRVDLKNNSSAILAGRYGDNLKTYTYATRGVTGFSKLAIELAIEKYRLINCPFKPSRESSTYLFLTEADARLKFNDFDGSNNTHCILEVTVDNTNAKYHIGSYDRYLQINPLTDTSPFLPKMETYSELYWNSVPDGVMELIVESNVTVIQVLP
jgi:hypothetical protein